MFRSAKVIAFSVTSLAPLRAVSACPSNALMAWCAAEIKTVESLPRLLDTLFRKRPHFRRNIETIGGGHSHLLLWIGVDCYAVKACDLLKYQQPKRPSAPAQTEV